MVWSEDLNPKYLFLSTGNQLYIISCISEQPVPMPDTEADINLKPIAKSC